MGAEGLPNNFATISLCVIKKKRKKKTKREILPAVRVLNAFHDLNTCIEASPLSLRLVLMGIDLIF